MPYTDPEKKKAYDRAYQRAHLEAHRVTSRAYYSRNIEKERARSKAKAKAYRLANRDKVNHRNLLSYHRVGWLTQINRIANRSKSEMEAQGWQF